MTASIGWAAQTPLSSPHPEAALNLLEAHCVKCHGGEKTKAGLDLTTRDALLRGGESGPAIILGQPQASLFYRMVAHLEDPGMPHKAEPLPEPAVRQFLDWIAAGVPYPRHLDLTPPATAPGTQAAGQASGQTGFAITAADRAHWAFQPVRRPEPPAVKNQGWASSPVDAFILVAQEKNGLQPAPRATKAALIRRVTFDLIGLPPTPEDVEAFARDPSPAAYSQLIDRLLASPHYGERWGRHWLDLARFAESDGFEHDAVRPNAWRYRDYVVRAFNQDKPYDRFIREQVAGDELFPEEPDALIATAFNLLGPDMVDSADQIQRQRNTLNDMTDTTALAFLGLTMGCARCHDHKFEPISHRDYYALQAFFAPAKFRTDLPVPTAAERTAHEAAMQDYNEKTRPQQQQLAELEGPYRSTLYERKLGQLSPEAQAAHRTPREKRTAEQENQLQETAALVEISNKELLAAMTKPDRARHQALLDELKPFPKPRPLPASLALQGGPPVKTHVLVRGDYAQPGAAVLPDFPEVLRDRGSLPRGQAGELAPEAPIDSAETTPPVVTAGRRQQRAPLAHWIAGADNPLTARVMVNRIWQHHFGRGLVPTPSDFGTHGQKPSHPELLDWLAAEFMTRGWSIKQMHRLILLSATYQQASSVDSVASSRDPENRFYARMHRVRLEGEVIRDSLLAISGRLNAKIGGPGVFPPIPKELFEGAKGWTPNNDAREHTRRSLYIFVRRNLRFPFLEVFDAPDNNLSCPTREQSTTAPQALTLLNAEEVLTAADLTAQRILALTTTDAVKVNAPPDASPGNGQSPGASAGLRSRSGPGPELDRESVQPGAFSEPAAGTGDAVITCAYRLILGRVPSEQERALSRDFLAHSPLKELCRALFNLNAFVYAD